MRRATLLILLFALLPVVLAAQVTGTIAAGGQGRSSSDAPATFRELNDGEWSGAFVDLLELRSEGTAPWTLRSAYSSGRRGYADFEIGNGVWKGGFAVTEATGWSSLSFAEGVLPSGVAVSSVHPGTTALDPAIGPSDPHLSFRFAEGYLQRSVGTNTTFAVRIRHRDRNGDRVPNVGGFSFSDVGTASFFTAGMEGVDSSSTSAMLEARTLAGPVGLRFDAGLSARDTATRFTLPAFGDSSLLDLNRWDQSSEADTRWLRLSAVLPGRSWSLQGSGSYTSGSAQPSGRDFRTTTAGAVVRDGLRVDGDVDSTATTGALGFNWTIANRVTLHLAADTQQRSGEGSGSRFLRGAALDTAMVETDVLRTGATADVASRIGRTLLRLRSRVSTTETDYRQETAALFEDLTRRNERTEVRFDATHPFSKRARGRAWVRYADETGEVELRDLTNGFAAGDFERDEAAAGFELSFGRDRSRTLISASAAQQDFRNGAPYFDPVFDPSLAIAPVDGTSRNLRLAASNVFTLGRGTVWGEAGWLQTEYDFDGTFDHAGFAFVTESVSGLTALVGTDFTPRDGTRLSGSFEVIRDQEDLDRTLRRATVELGHEVRSGVEIFGRWIGGDLTAPRSPFDEHNVNLFALGVRTTF